MDAKSWSIVEKLHQNFYFDVSNKHRDKWKNAHHNFASIQIQNDWVKERLMADVADVLNKMGIVFFLFWKLHLYSLLVPLSWLSYWRVSHAFRMNVRLRHIDSFLYGSLSTVLILFVVVFSCWFSIISFWYFQYFMLFAFAHGIADFLANFLLQNFQIQVSS